MQFSRLTRGNFEKPFAFVEEKTEVSRQKPQSRKETTDKLNSNDFDKPSRNRIQYGIRYWRTLLSVWDGGNGVYSFFFILGFFTFLACVLLNLGRNLSHDWSFSSGSLDNSLLIIKVCKRKKCRKCMKVTRSICEYQISTDEEDYKSINIIIILTTISEYNR